MEASATRASRALLSKDYWGDWRDREIDAILNEMEYFPVAHFLLPGVIYKLTGSWKLAIGVFFVWEYLEQAFPLVFGSLSLYPNDTSTEPDSVLSDWTMGFLGLFSMISFAVAGNVPRPWVDVWTRRTWRRFFKYVFQFLAIAALTLMLEVDDKHPKNNWTPTGYFVFWFGTDALLVLWALWNWNDPVLRELHYWEGSDDPKRPGVLRREWQEVRLIGRDKLALEVSYLIVVNFVFASSYYRFVGPFQIMCADAGVLIAVAFGVVWPLRRAFLPEFPRECADVGGFLSPQHPAGTDAFPEQNAPSVTGRRSLPLKGPRRAF